jgi:hypothetical protein
MEVKNDLLLICFIFAIDVGAERVVDDEVVLAECTLL